MIMHKGIKKIWIKSLRSGKYKQGKGDLKRGNNYCCLGVLLDKIKHHKEINGKFSESGVFHIGDDRLRCTLNNKINKYTGIKPIHEETLISFNDHYGLSFNEIADWIEKRL